MKLRRIEAESFGALQNGALGEFGDGLTVVLGPNESGKSTYAALLRQLLYGFPDKRARDYGYQPRTGGRAGRLVFEGPDGRWALGRSEGPKGGTVRVDTLHGSERERLLAEVIGSVAEPTFRVVFGFGLDELADIETGSDKDVMSRLFAGAKGLSVNPMDVRKTLEDAAGALFKARGNAVVTTLLGEMKDVKAEIRELESQARAFAGSQARLRDMEQQLEPLKTQRDGIEHARRQVERDLERVRGIVRDRAEAAERIAEVSEARGSRLREAERAVVDERLLGIAAELDTVLEEESGAKQLADRARQLESRAAELRRSAGTLQVPEGVTDCAESRAALEAWRDRRARLEAEADGATRSAEAAEAKARAHEQVSAASADQGARLGAPVAELLVVALGIAAMLAGWLARQWVALGLGGATFLCGLVMFVLKRRGVSAAHGLAADLGQLRVDSHEKAEIALKAQARLEDESERWSAWLVEQGLHARGAEPAAVAALLDDARRRAELVDQAEAAEAEASRDRDEVSAWAERLAGLACGPLGVANTGVEPHALALRAREALAAVTETRDRRVKAVEAVELADAELQRVAAKDSDRQREIDAIATARGVEGDLVLELEDLATSLTEKLADASAAYEDLANTRAELAGQLGVQGRDDALARARQRLEGLEADAYAAADRYMVEALAVRLIDRARERFERDRQPDVVRTAERVFQTMTDGRYAGVRVPLGGESITVIGATGEVLPTAKLSRGTAEQLYLALRVGLIQSFGEQGPHLPVLMDDIVVNYDAERVGRSSAAISELSSSRQVIFFTCHEATAAALVLAVPDAVELRLGRCSL